MTAALPARATSITRFPAIVAHRGASTEYPENTLAAFAAAADAGVDAVELDVRRTVDGVLVVMHDPDVQRTTDGHGYVAELTAACIKRFEPEIPTLDDVLRLLHGRTGLEIEIKNHPDEPGYEPGATTIVREAIESLERFAFADACITSFDLDSLASVKRLAPWCATGVTVEDLREAEKILQHVAGLHGLLLPGAEDVEAAGKAFVDFTQERGISLCVWTVDDPDRITQLYALGVVAVETNDVRAGVLARNRYVGTAPASAR